MIKRVPLLSVLLIIGYIGFCQAPLNQFKITSSNTSFPDTGRMQGHSHPHTGFFVASV